MPEKLRHRFVCCGPHDVYLLSFLVSVLRKWLGPFMNLTYTLNCELKRFNVVAAIKLVQPEHHQSK